jgi:hypothetical protein
VAVTLLLVEEGGLGELWLGEVAETYAYQAEALFRVEQHALAEGQKASMSMWMILRTCSL